MKSKFRYFLFTILALVLTVRFFGPGADAIAHADFSQNLSFGETDSAQVTALQQFLTNEDLYSGPITGNFFNLTQTAVRAFQTQTNITPVSGYFGPKTRAAANALLDNASASASTSSTSNNTSSTTASTQSFQSSQEAQLESLLQELQTLNSQLNSEAQTLASIPTSSLMATPLPPPSDVPINVQSIVGLNCYFKYTPTGQIFNFAKGSGVIIDPSGIILTARHLVDIKFAASIDPTIASAQLADNAVFDHCDVGQVPAGSALPSASEIQSFNPTIQVPALTYTAHLDFTPSDAGLSSAEADDLDISLLKIDSVSQAGTETGVTQVPASFPFSVLLQNQAPPDGAQVLSYGYPGDVTTGMGAPFTTLYLVGDVGSVKQTLLGNQAFANTPLLLNTDMDVADGRSGSPVFWHGYVVGIVTAHDTDNVTDSYSVSSPAIEQTIGNIIN